MSLIQKSIVHCTSTHRLPSEGICNYEVFLRGKLQNCFRVVPQSAVIPNTFYNITSRNNSFIFNIVGVGPFELNLANGYYSLNDGAPNNLIVALNANILLVTGNLNTWFSFDFTTMKIALNHMTADVEVSSAGNMNTTLGFLATGQIVGTGNRAVAPNMVDLRGVETVYVHLSFIETGHYLTEARKDIEVPLKEDVICQIQMNVPFGSTVYWQVNEEELLSYTFRGLRSISNFTITLTDEENNVLDTNGLDWSFDFVCYE